MAKPLTKADLERIGRTWIDRIQQAEKREEDWYEAARSAEAAYLARDDEEGQKPPLFNVLHSNVETIVPAIYNSTPEPDIRPRHNKKDPVGKVVSDILERAISAQIDDNRLDAEIEANAQDAFVAGRGIVRIKFEADEIPAVVQEVEVYDEATGEIVVQEGETQPARVVNERILFEAVSWRDYREGPAKRWSDVPWVAYRHEVSESEKQALEDSEIAAAYGAEEDKRDEDKDCTIWEIWCRETKRVYFVTEDGCKVLSITDDPLKLSNFFPQPAPVQPITGTGQRTPTCPYRIYKALAEELDKTTKRINAITNGLKVRGLIAGDAEVIEQIAALGDNELMPVANIENLVAAGGLEKAVMWWPVDKAIQVLQQLYVSREQTKQAIYEITGISDIIRGQGAASESATAQTIKTQWGSLRIKKMQKMIERQVRDLFVLSAEAMSNLFSFEALEKASGIPFTQEEGAEQIAALLSKPLDHYRIDVESDSTVRADLTKNRQEMSQFLQGTAQFFSTLYPVVQQAPEAIAPMAKMYSAFARQYALGKSAEDALEQFVNMAESAGKKPKQPSPEQQKMQADLMERGKKLELAMQEFAHKRDMDMRDQARKDQDLLMSTAFKQAEMGLKQDQLDLDEAKATVDAAAKFSEIELEETQERPVRVG